MPNYDLVKLAGAFNRIAPVFDVVRPLFYRNYLLAVDYALEELNIGPKESPKVLDIGTGTGTLAGAFAARGAAVTGIDVSSGMLEQARKRYGSQLTLLQKPAHALTEFDGGSFDIVSAGFVLHEMPFDYRLKVLREMQRVSGAAVVVVDYVPNINPVISLVERMENSHYREFLATVDLQLRQVFGGYWLNKLSHFIGLYLCRK